MRQIEIHSQNQKELISEIWRIFSFNIICQSYLIIFSCKLILLFDSKYIIIFSWIMDLATFILILTDKNIGKSMSIIYFLDKVLSVAFKITIVIHFEIQPIKLYFIPSIQLSITVVLFLYFVLKHESAKKKHLIVAQSYSVLYVVQMLLLSLKWNDIFNYTYYQIFIISWTCLGINIFLVILLLITLVENCFIRHLPQLEAKSIFWMIWYLVGLTVIPFFLLQTICQYYEESNLYGNIQIASIAYVVGIVIYVIIFTVFTCRIKNNLIQLLQNEQSRPQTPSKIVKEKPIKKWRKLRIPLLFIRISASYYRMLSRQSTNDTTTIRNTSALPINSDILRPDSLNFRQSPCQTIMKQIKSQPKDQDSNDFCLICFENEAEVVLHPCNHGGICQKCADHMIQTTKQCFLCRTQIKYALKVHQQGQIMEAIDVQKV